MQFFTCCIRIRIPNPNPDPDAGGDLNPDPTGSGSATLLVTKFLINMITDPHHSKTDTDQEVLCMDVIINTYQFEQKG